MARLLFWGGFLQKVAHRKWHEAPRIVADTCRVETYPRGGSQDKSKGGHNGSPVKAEQGIGIKHIQWQWQFPSLAMINLPPRDAPLDSFHCTLCGTRDSLGTERCITWAFSLV